MRDRLANRLISPGTSIEILKRDQKLTFTNNSQCINSKAFSWKLLLISDRILFTWVFLFLTPDLFYFNENKGNMFYVISLYNKIRHFEWRLFPRPSNLLALKGKFCWCAWKKDKVHIYSLHQLHVLHVS